MLQLRITVCLIAVLFLAIATAADTAIKNIDKIRYRLPSNTRPEKYEIAITTRVDINDFAFSGNVTIDIVVDYPTNKIFLHARKLTISSVSLWQKNREVKIRPFTYDDVSEFLTITSDKDNFEILDRLRLIIAYNGTLRTDNAGFYRSSYLNSRGDEVWIAATHHEPNNARHSFPCYDEPGYRATFKIRIIHGKGYHAISNMPVSGFEHDGQGITTSFQESPSMPTYLVAYVVSNYKFSTNTVNPNEFAYRVYANPSKIESTQLALDTGVNVINAFQEYLQVNYTMPKMDQVAVPDFLIGAMENWGLVLYKEEYLLYNKTEHPYWKEVSVVGLIAHEFSHQWFGNLVTINWWSYSWLKEGFATLFQAIGTDLLHPEWNIFDQFLVTSVQKLLRTDASNDLRPMTHYEEEPAMVAFVLFDNVAYTKSGSVIRMFQHAFTEKSFRKGLNYYLTNNAYTSAQDSELFVSLERAVKEDWTIPKGVDVKTIFSSWSNQRGFPVLIVDRDYRFNVAKLSQERYTHPNINAKKSSIWHIPYNYATSKNSNFVSTSPTGWLHAASKQVQLNGDTDWSDWVLFNVQQTGYYRVLYDNTNWNLLIEQLRDNHTVIHPRSRAQLIDDLFDFVISKRISPHVFFDLASYLNKETEYVAWVPAANAFERLNKMLINLTLYDRFYSFGANLSKPLYEEVGLFENKEDTFLRKELRTISTDLACLFGVPACLIDTYNQLKTLFIHDGILPPINTQAIIFRNGFRSATDDDLEVLWNRLVTSKDSTTRNLITNSFGYISREDALNKYLERTLNETTNSMLSTHERSNIFWSAAIYGGEHGLSACIRIISENNSLSVDTFGIYDFNEVVVNLANRIFTKSLQNQFILALKKLGNSKDLSESTIIKSQTTVAYNLQWFEESKNDIDNWFLPKNNASSGKQLSTWALIWPITTLIYLLWETAL